MLPSLRKLGGGFGREEEEKGLEEGFRYGFEERLKRWGNGFGDAGGFEGDGKKRRGRR